MNILIIGGSGHVSGAISRRAVTNGDNVYIVTRGERIVPAGVTALIADRHDLQAMEQLIAGQNMSWDLVVDCICYKPADMEQNIALFAQRTKQFVMISTDFVYHPELRKFPQSETDACYVSHDNSRTASCGDNSLSYGMGKRLCEELLISGKMGEVNWTIFRPCHIYGPTSELGCLPLHGRDPELITKMRQEIPLELVGGGHFLQQPILVDDLAEMILSCYANPLAYNKIFNAAGPDIIESWQFYQIIADILGVELQLKELPVAAYLIENPEKAPFMCHRIYDLQAAKTAQLTLPSTSIKAGLKLHVEGLLKR